MHEVVLMAVSAAVIICIFLINIQCRWGVF
jgi:hypothetical protein